MAVSFNSSSSSKASKTALGQLVEDGGFKGGLAPYGYDHVKSGRFNKRKLEVFELAINEAEDAVVRIIFDKYVHEGFGAQRISTYLNNLGYRARTGKMWNAIMAEKDSRPLELRREKPAGGFRFSTIAASLGLVAMLAVVVWFGGRGKGQYKHFGESIL